MSELTSSNWSETAASNNAAAPNGWPEGMNPSDVNNAAREMMAAIKRWFNRVSGAYTAGGGTTAYTLTPSVAITAYADEIWSWIMPSTNAVDATMNISALGARNIQKLTTAGYANVAAGDMPSGAMIQARYSTSASKFYILSVTPIDLTAVTLLASLKSFNTPGHRLSLTTALSVTVSDVTAATTIYWTPHQHNVSPVYNGSAWILSALAEKSFIMDTGNHLSGKNYDIFLDYNSGTPRIVTGPAWTNDTTRADAISRDATYSWYVNTSSMTGRISNNGGTVTVAAGAGLYLGTIRCSANGQTEDSFSKRFVWNKYNRVVRTMSVLDTTDTWNYSTATFRQANAATTNQLSYVCGLNEETVQAIVNALCGTSAAIQGVRVAVGVDSTSTPSGTIGSAALTSGNGAQQLVAQYVGTPGLGYHYLAWLEKGAGADTQTWYGDNGGTDVQSGIMGSVLA